MPIQHLNLSALEEYNSSRTIAKKKLTRDDPHWTKEEFENRFTMLQRLEGELKQIIDELEPDIIQWPSTAFAAYLFAPHSDQDWLKTFSNKRLLFFGS